MCSLLLFFFFFSSRRRHTRFDCDWSSDVCSSDLSLFRLAPVLDAIEVDAPVLRLTQQSLGHFDVDDVLARLAEPGDTPPSKPVGFALYNIALRDGRVELQDEVQRRQHMLEQLQLQIGRAHV